MRERLEALSRAADDRAALHALLAWLDERPAALLIVAEARVAVLGGPHARASRALAHLLPHDPEVEERVSQRVELEKSRARVYWEHPAMIWSGILGDGD